MQQRILFFYRIFLPVVLSLGLSNCNTTKYINSDQAYLSKNNVEINGKVTDKLAFKDEIESLFKQRPVSLRKRWFYFKTKGRIQRRFGEKPTIYDPILSAKTAETIQFFLQNKGYYKAKVSYTKKIKKQHAQVTYILNLDNRYLIDSVHYISEDVDIQKIMNAVADESILKRGTALEVNVYRAEVNRLTNIIRNFGYANFYGNYFAPFSADSSHNKANVKLVALLPNDAKAHTKYNFGKIKVYANYSTDIDPSEIKDTLINGITFYAPQGVFPIKLTTLANCISILPKSTFRQEHLDLTYRKFESLNAFRLINIKTEFSTANKQEVDVVISLVPYGKRSISSSFELNTTQGGAALGNNVGLALSANLKNNNVFGNAERLNTNLEFSVQGILGNNQNLFYETSLQQDFSVPKFFDPIRFWKSLNRLTLYNKGTSLNPKPIKVLSDADYQNLKIRASSKLSAGVKIIQSIPIDYLQINANVGYGVPLSANRALNINQLSLEYLNPVKIQSPISENDFLRRLFGKQLVTSIIFKDFNYIAQHNARTPSAWSRKLRLSFEQSGLELFTFNRLLDASDRKTAPFKFFGFDYSRFVRSELDWSLGKKIGWNQSLHLHLNLGAAIPYGYSNTIVPYVKQFFVGGPTSMRGWQPRELGPGGWQNQTSSSTSYYATGDLKMEANAELRFGLWWIFKSAFFIDAGNVWALHPNQDFDNGHITASFYEQVAVTAGTGLRIDFDYSVIRFDFGYRLRYPYADINRTHWNWNNPNFKNWNLTFGLGYPF
jgi:outer membrane protein insertion porin family